MGTYNLCSDEIVESFEEWLKGQEGEVHADVMAETWNRLASKHVWEERLMKEIRMPSRWAIWFIRGMAILGVFTLVRIIGSILYISSGV